MAERKVNANDILLFIDPAGADDYSLVVCLEDQTFPRSRSVIDAKSKCGPDKSLDILEIGDITFSGQVILSPATDRIGIATLDLLIKNNTTIGWKWGVAVPTSGDVTYSGTGAISNLEEQASQGDKAKFSASLTVYGNYTTVTTA